MGLVTREQLHDLVDSLPWEHLPAAKATLEKLQAKRETAAEYWACHEPPQRPPVFGGVDDAS